ncbi:MAG: methionine--tRNA ligase [bacterium]|nr:methionine--tRNA ligase [bacterium]
MKFYITTTLPYVNSDPHIGFALEIIQADAIVRYRRLLGDDVFYNTGTDEHGLKIYRKSLEAGVEPQVYCDQWADKFKKLEGLLNLDSPTFIRTTDAHHVSAAQKFWEICLDNGDIYKKNYQVKYCVGCELEKTESELVDGKCLVHPSQDLELIDEENYFFRFSKYEKVLLEYYKKNPGFVVPNHRFNEIKEFVKSGLVDFSISRIKEKMPWGVPVPGDTDHVMYVWFDALINYISTLGWPDNSNKFKEYWGTIDKPNAVQVAGKDNLRQQSAMWQAMLASAGLPFSKQVFIHGFVTSKGRKMSKSEGNVVDPYNIVNKYGVDAVRYYLLGAISSYEDGDFSLERFEEFYGAHLANGIGNLTSRILTMVEKYCDSKVPEVANDIFDTKKFWDKYETAFGGYRFDEIIRLTQELVGKCDEKISTEKPWEKAKQTENIFPLLYQLTECLRHIAFALLPIIPESAEKILNKLGIKKIPLGALGEEKDWQKLQKGAKVNKGDALFPRL